MISIIIPFKNNSEMTILCVESIIKYSELKEQEYEIILISNNSLSSELNKISNSITTINNVKLFEYNKPFNYQKINNWGAKKANGKILLFMNNDTELTQKSEGLIKEMQQFASKEDVGAVGCLLLYGDKKHIQHAGVYLIPNGTADHLFIRKEFNKVKNDKDYPLLDDRKVTAVTGAVLMVDKNKFNAVKGFDEEFIICGGDVDLCIRLNNKGYQTWCISGGGKYILHKEKMTRSETKVPYVDYYKSYESYITAYDLKNGDKYLPKAIGKE